MTRAVWLLILPEKNYKSRREVYTRRHTIGDTFKRDIDRREIVHLLGGED